MHILLLGNLCREQLVQHNCHSLDWAQVEVQPVILLEVTYGVEILVQLVTHLVWQTLTKLPREVLEDL